MSDKISIKQKKTFSDFSLYKNQSVLEDEDSIAQSIYSILLYKPKERFFRPQFGIDLESFCFEELTFSSSFELEMNLKNAIFQSEPRIKDINMSFTQFLDENKIHINLIIILKDNSEIPLSFDVQSSV